VRRFVGPNFFRISLSALSTTDSTRSLRTAKDRYSGALVCRASACSTPPMLPFRAS
jgi:hypothetical protein